jgi:hypothetical protein
MRGQSPALRPGQKSPQRKLMKASPEVTNRAIIGFQMVDAFS